MPECKTAKQGGYNALEGMTGKMADMEQKLSNVEHQLETAKVEVTKLFAQEQEGEPDRAESTQEVADVPRGRISVKEKLAQMREKAYGKKSLETPDISKEKGQKEIIM